MTRAVEALRIRETETLVFAALNRTRPHELPVDLAVKALMALGWLYVAIFSLRGNADPSDFGTFYLFAALASLRLLWLARAAAVRGARVIWLAVPVAVLVVGARIANPYETPQPGPKNAALALTLSLQPDLTGADLRGRDLSDMYLSGKPLTQANLEYADLSGTDLTGASLQGARADWAQFDRANLRGADLTGASLFDATLDGADLTRAKLRRTDLTGATIEGALLCNADLRATRLDGLEGRPYTDAKTRWPHGYKPPRPPDDFDACTQ